jgi:hypothetical protein
LAYLEIAATANALYDKPNDKHVTTRIKYIAFAESCTKNNNEAIINPKVPTRVKIQILVTCGFIKFQSSLVPKNLDVLTNDPINIPKATKEAITIPGVPVKKEPILDVVDPPEPELLAVVRLTLLFAGDDILSLIKFLLFC